MTEELSKLLTQACGEPKVLGIGFMCWFEDEKHKGLCGVVGDAEAGIYEWATMADIAKGIKVYCGGRTTKL